MDEILVTFEIPYINETFKGSGKCIGESDSNIKISVSEGYMKGKVTDMPIIFTTNVFRVYLN